MVDPAIAAHKGRIVKTTGDGMLVEFGSAVDAVTCAMSVQTSMGDRNIFGDGVNVAARIEAECEPGGVYLSANAYEQIRSKTSFAFDDMGERQLKNIGRFVSTLPAQVNRRLLS